HHHLSFNCAPGRSASFGRLRPPLGGTFRLPAHGSSPSLLRPAYTFRPPRGTPLRESAKPAVAASPEPKPVVPCPALPNDPRRGPTDAKHSGEIAFGHSLRNPASRMANEQLPGAEDEGVAALLVAVAEALLGASQSEIPKEFVEAL